MRHRANRRKLHGALALALFLGLIGGCLDLATTSILCKTTADCPVTGECGVWTCKEGSCVVDAKPSGTVPATQVLGDCKRLVCDGEGNAVTEPSDEDTIPDGTPCTTDKCVDGTPAYEPAPAGTPCGVDDKLQCNGAGACVGCIDGDGSECGPQEACATWLCAVNTCSRILKADGTFINDPKLGDCRADYCDAVGQVVSRPYNDDKKDDGDPCTTNDCMDGAPVYPPGPDGTPCGMGCQICTGGVCGECGPPNYECDTAAQKCIPLLQVPNGTACSASTDCASGNCVDGVCCDDACAAPCSACNNAKTGQPDGTCSPVTNGTDPDNECQSPAADVCVAGQCQCYNGIQDGGEIKVDCGGNCAPCPGKWQCDGTPVCDGAQKSFCCFPGCGTCVDQAAECKAMHGTACALGQPDKTFALGTMSTPQCTACRFSTCKCQ